jgi:hypothetical protein
MSTPTNLQAISRPPLGRLALSLTVLALSLVVLLFALTPGNGLRPAWAQTQTFVFTFAGDFGTGSAFTANLNQMAQSGAVFDLAVGDLSYGSSASAWCNSVTSIVGATFPFELVAGNHDDDGNSVRIGDFTPCLPDRMGSTGTYGSEYYFDYNNARIIMIAAASTVNGINYDYNTVGGTHYNWLQARIQEAKAAGKWVIVGDHKNCITAATKSCEIGQNFLNLIHNEHVDLLIQGHDHTYQRSKQLTCATANTFNAACVADADDSYVKGAGTVTIIDGLGGNGQYNINASDSERNYFVKSMGGNGWWNFRDSTSGAGHEYGVVKITVSANQLDEAWVPSQVVAAGFPGDSFSIVNAGGPTNTPGPTATPTNTPVPGPVMHVADVLTTDVNGTPQTTFTRGGTVYWRVKIVDANNAVVSGASVTTQALKPDGSSWTTLSATTGTDGWALFSKKSNGNNPLGTYTINVTNVTKTGATYNPSANVKSSTTFVLQ